MKGNRNSYTHRSNLMFRLFEDFMEKKAIRCNGTFFIKKSKDFKKLEILYRGNSCAISFDAFLTEYKIPVINTNRKYLE